MKKLQLSTACSILLLVFLVTVAFADGGKTVRTIERVDALSFFAATPTAGIPRLTINSVDPKAFPAITALAIVTDKNNQPVAGLSPSDWHLYEDDQEISDFKVVPARNTNIGIVALLLIDTSGSMKGQPLSVAQEAGKGFLDVLDPRDQCAIMSFSTEPNLKQDFTTDKNKCQQALGTLAAGGWTALFDSADQAVGRAGTVPNGRHVVVLLTDGRDEGGNGQFGVPLSTHTCQDVTTLAQQKGVPIYTIGVGDDSQLDLDALQCLAQGSGGEFNRLHSFATEGESLKALYQNIAAQLQNQYQFSYQTRLPADGKSHILRITTTISGAAITDTFTFQFPTPTPTKTLTETPTDTPTETSTPTDTPTTTPTPTATPTPTPPPFAAAVTSTSACLLGLVIFVAIIVFGASRGGFLFSGTRPSGNLPSPSGAVDEDMVSTERGFGLAAVTPTVALKRKGEPAALLIMTKGTNTGKEYVIKSGLANIGRDANNDIILNDDAVSRQHARLRFENGDFYLTDLDSLNHTFVNGERITRRVLSDGDRIQIGSMVLSFRRTG